MLDVARSNHPIVSRNLGPDIVPEREVPSPRRTSPELWGECSSITVKRWKPGKRAGRSFVGQRAVHHGPMKGAIDEEGHAFPRGLPVGICTGFAFKLRSPARAGSFAVIEQGADAADFPPAGCRAPGDRCCGEAS